jgi:hypothetical protein
MELLPIDPMPDVKVAIDHHHPRRFTDRRTDTRVQDLGLESGRQRAQLGQDLGDGCGTLRHLLQTRHLDPAIVEDLEIDELPHIHMESHLVEEVMLPCIIHGFGDLLSLLRGCASVLIPILEIGDVRRQGTLLEQAFQKNMRSDRPHLRHRGDSETSVRHGIRVCLIQCFKYNQI